MLTFGDIFNDFMKDFDHFTLSKEWRSTATRGGVARADEGRSDAGRADARGGDARAGVAREGEVAFCGWAMRLKVRWAEEGTDCRAGGVAPAECNV